MNATLPLLIPVAISPVLEEELRTRLAARELRRGFYLRTGRLLPISSDIEAGPGEVVVSLSLVDEPVLGAEGYRIATSEGSIRISGSAQGLLYGAYRLLHYCGLRFHLHRDTIPDQQEPVCLPVVNEVRKPLFAVRGFHPFHDFAEGPDWWSREHWLHHVDQMPKMGFNQLALHTYPEGGVGAEPAVWIGTETDLDENGRIRAAYRSYHYNTAKFAWGYRPAPTSSFRFGADRLFADDWHCADYQRGLLPVPADGAGEIELFERFGGLLEEVFQRASELGIDGAVGLELPLMIPTQVADRLRASGHDPADDATLLLVWRGILRRVQQRHRCRWFWLQTPEAWTGGQPERAEIDRAVADLRLAEEAHAALQPEFGLALAGWTVGPMSEPLLMHRAAKPGNPLSSYLRDVGRERADPLLGRMRPRPTWSVLWMEDDPALTSPQLWVGRTRRDLADARALGCSGVFAMLWRTAALAPQLAAFAAAAWEQEWNPDPDAVWDGSQSAGEGFEGGSVVSGISGTDDPLLQNCRRDPLRYRLRLAPGRYQIFLKTARGPAAPSLALDGNAAELQKSETGLGWSDWRVDWHQRHGNKVDLSFSASERLDLFAIVIDGKADAFNQLPEQDVRRIINCGGPGQTGIEAELPGLLPGGRTLPTEDFWQDYCRSEFGPEAGPALAAVFAGIDHVLPRPTSWHRGPGGIPGEPRPWAEVVADYAFVEELTALEPSVQGAGSQARFSYWLGLFRGQRALHRAACQWYEFQAALKDLTCDSPNPADWQRDAKALLWPIRRDLVEALDEAVTAYLSSACTTGDLGMLANLELHTFWELLDRSTDQIVDYTWETVPAELQARKGWKGEPRLFVTAPRTRIRPDEDLEISVHVLSVGDAQAVVLHWRWLEETEWKSNNCVHWGRGVWNLVLPAATHANRDFVWHLNAQTEGHVIAWPPGSPEINHVTLVV